MDKIKLQGKDISFVKNFSKKAKNISISIKNKELILTIPKTYFLNKKNIEQKAIDFLISKQNWILKHLGKQETKNKDILNNSKKHFLENKKQAEILCKEKVEFWAKKMGNLQYNKISVKSLKTRWGSCSSKKNLNFNYKILFLKKEEQDYLIVHELSHLVFMDHSENFWNLVCSTLKNKKYRKYKIKY